MSLVEQANLKAITGTLSTHIEAMRKRLHDSHVEALPALRAGYSNVLVILDLGTRVCEDIRPQSLHACVQKPMLEVAACRPHFMRDATDGYARVVAAFDRAVYTSGCIVASLAPALLGAHASIDALEPRVCAMEQAVECARLRGATQ